VFKNRERLTLQVERFANSTPDYASAIGGLDHMDFVFFGNGRKPDQFPAFLLQHVSDKIVFVKALHNYDDATRPLVV
jgi:hypothetical protein